MIKINNQIEELKAYIDNAEIITFYGGAGTSTESGIPDYRSKHGRWTALQQDGFDPVKVATATNMMRDPEKYFRKRENENNVIPEPNATHKILAEMEQSGMDVRVITQNVDSLHKQAGHRYVLELHGNSRKWHCMTCQREYRGHEIERDEKNIPRCYVDKGIVRPNVVLFGENTNKDTVDKAKWTMKNTDLLIIAGTSLTTPLARRLVLNYEGKNIILINHDELDIPTIKPDLFIQDSVGEVFTQLKELHLSKANESKEAKKY